MVFFEELKTKLRAKFSQPYPSDISVLHHKCGGEVTYKQHYEMDDTYDELVCGKDGCEKVWTEKVLNRATAVEIHDWFTGRDNTVYKLETSAVDEYGNKQPRVYSFLKTK